MDSSLESELVCETPLSEKIMRAPLPEWFQLPTFELYNGSTDPWDHLNCFKSRMLILGTTDTTDAIMCRAFATSLKMGAAVNWFFCLPPRSIHNFTELSKAFITGFQSSISFKKMSINVNQRKGESLRAFMDRFNKEKLEVRSLNPETEYLGLLSGLFTGFTDEELRRSPLSKRPKDLPGLLARVEEYIHLEDSRATQKEEEEINKSKNRKYKDDRDTRPAGAINSAFESLL